MFAHDLLDMDCGLASMIEGNGGNEMMADMCTDDVVEEMSVDEAEVAVDGCSGSASEGPGLVVVVGHRCIGVLEEGDGDYTFRLVCCQNTMNGRRLTDPVVYPQPRNTPQDNDVPASEDLASDDKSSDHDSNTDIRKEDQWQLMRLVEDAVLAEIEVGNSQAGGAIVFLSGQVEEQISRPSKNLVDEIVPESSNRGILSKFCELDHVRLRLSTKVGLDPRLPSVRYKRRVLLDIARGLVMLRVRYTPRVEGYQQERMHDQPHCIVQLLRL